jgi:predicted DNA-binding transcriptional regulator AlpA
MDRIMLDDECRHISGLKPSERRSAIEAGRFPEGVRLPDGAIGWLESDISLWLHSVLQRRDDPGAAVAFVAPRPPWFARKRSEPSRPRGSEKEDSAARLTRRPSSRRVS